MLFESTRGGDKGTTFEEVLLKGLADDGGLYVPSKWPEADISKFKKCNSFIDIAKLIVPLFTRSSYRKEEVITLLETGFLTDKLTAGKVSLFTTYLLLLFSLSNN